MQNNFACNLSHVTFRLPFGAIRGSAGATATETSDEFEYEVNAALELPLLAVGKRAALRIKGVWGVRCHSVLTRYDIFFAILHVSIRNNIKPAVLFKQLIRHF